jgi:cytochrome c-type biogenesis protein CcmH
VNVRRPVCAPRPGLEFHVPWCTGPGKRKRFGGSCLRPRIGEGVLAQFRPVLVLGLVLLALAAPARAVQPDEMLADPALEARAREISQELRCLVCRNESIDDSNADLARDLRLLVREQLAAGDTNAEVKQFLVDRYGEFVLLRPTFSAANAALWLAGPLAFLLGLAVIVVYLRRRPPIAPRSLTPEEEAALERALRDR